MSQFHDQTGKFVFIQSSPPRRVVSLVPSLTELLYSLQLEDEVVGITKFCVHPEHWFRTKQRVGGTKNADIAAIQSLQPDLVIASKEENVREQVEAIEAFCPVYCSDISNLEDAYQAIAQIGMLTHRSAKAEELIEQLKANFAQLKPATKKMRCVYLIWNNPYMSVGGDTFINDMLTKAGFENVLQEKLRYPEIDLEQIASLDVEVILFSSEPFPFKQQHLEALATAWQQQIPQQNLPLLRNVDGEMFSWYGSRLLYATEYFKKLRESLFLSDELIV
ncbi:ABC-type Fe3+-hydroxamate transport system substrate-binding protein [Lacibacter cauensis]|uniref:ABC-type Fe3+-hydroxamate transport system substrate-binding protein n=1 Tax=Lacibacter cauensis TaxID=510947 RepID=A0A562SXA4_9BACT|nr:helical backbone metal receptor [Lacibacter cauensis]TWI85400.1 ABC-type Fe3+-hydroxamate transport system substrate-binding protein [Lacibacter cauensis]